MPGIPWASGHWPSPKSSRSPWRFSPIHYPDVPLHGDFTLLRDEDWIAGADILVGGTPCQGFSIAGLRRSLDDARGNLTLEFLRLADAIDERRAERDLPPCIIVWENVPGVLSVRDNALGCFLSGLCGRGTPLRSATGKMDERGCGSWTRACSRVADPATPNFSDWPNGAVVCSLSQVLERGSIPRRFFLSSKACAGDCSAAQSKTAAMPRSVSSGSGMVVRQQRPRSDPAGAGRITEADTLVHGATGQRSHWDGMENPPSRP